MSEAVQPKISVVMPAYNAENYIREAIDSILAQTFRDFEFLIIDDGSTDHTVEIIRSYSDSRIRLYQNERNMGVAATLNRGLDLARGEYIARMDADDISLPERFAKQAAYMDAHPDVAVCGSNIILFSEGAPERPYFYASSDAQIRANMVFNSAFAHPSVFLRKHVLEKARLRYDCQYEKAEDYELWVRILQHAKGKNIQEPLLRYRSHAAQTKYVHTKTQHTAAQNVRKKILEYCRVALREDEWEAFQKISDGIRTLSEREYSAFFSGGKKIIRSFHRGRRELKAIYVQLNLAVLCHSELKHKSFFSWKEPVWLMLSKAKGNRHEH